MTRPLIRLKSNLRWLCVILLFTRSSQSYLYINKVLLPTLSTSRRPIHTTTCTERCKGKGNIHTHTHTRHTQFKQGEDHSNWDRLPDSSGRPHPSTRARSAFTCLTQSPHPLTRGGLAVGSTSVSILRWGIAYQDDLPIHDGFLKRAPRISATQTNGKIRQKGRHNGGWKYLWKLEEEEKETESQKAQEQARK